MSEVQTETEKREQLARLEAVLKQWVGFKTSTYWRMESERVRLIGELP